MECKAEVYDDDDYLVTLVNEAGQTVEVWIPRRDLSDVTQPIGLSLAIIGHYE